jgi:hypothetical protein
MKHFHGVSAGNVHECSLKSRIGKARIEQTKKDIALLTQKIKEQGA